MKRVKSNARRSRAMRTRHVIARSRKLRIVVHRSSMHTYAQLIDPEHQTLLSASTLEKDLRKEGKTATVSAAKVVGERLAAKIKEAGIEDGVAFDRSGFKYHGRVKAVAQGISEGGVKL